MSDIFVSYASEDRERAHDLADTLGARGWSVWWDRKIPLGKSFDAVIEEALGQAKCVVVLWSGVSVSSEWVRNEASEAKRREILVPAFIEDVDAPLAFRLLNGANLTGWHPGSVHPEFDKLIERIEELVGKSAADHTKTPTRAVHVSKTRAAGVSNWLWSPFGFIALAFLIVGSIVGGYFIRERKQAAPKNRENPASLVENALKTGTLDRSSSPIEKSINDFAAMFGGAVPATSLARGFHVPDLGLRIAYLTQEQSAATLGALPAGAVVMEVESGKPMARAGIHVGDVVDAIGGKKISGENDLRQAIFKIGPGKTTYSYRRGNESKTITVECAGCKAE
jgi:hypothetical protein